MGMGVLCLFSFSQGFSHFTALSQSKDVRSVAFRQAATSSCAAEMHFQPMPQRPQHRA